MKLVIGSDKMGYGLKEIIKETLTEQGHEVTDVGTTTLEKPKLIQLRLLQRRRQSRQGRRKGEF